MLKNQDIICISSIDWDFIWQGHQEIMSTLASNGNRILFIENTGVRSPSLRDLPRLKKRIYNWFHSVKGIRKEREGLYIYSPLILPFPYSSIARRINRRLLVSALKRWIRSVGFSNPVIWTFLPTALVLDIIDAINNKIVIYYCIDNFSASSPQARRIIKTEKVLLQRADLVFVTSKNLYDSCARYNKNVHIFPYGVSMDVYENAAEEKIKMPGDIASIRRPIVGYIGGVHKWIDFELVRFLANENRKISFVFVGPLQIDVASFKEMPNIHFLDQKSYDQLPSYISQFDACIIPYLLTEYTKNVYPTKINEYLSLGKPVISTPIPEVEAFNERNGDIIFIGKTKEGFSALINNVLRDKTSPEVHEKRRYTAIKEGSWSAKIEDMSRLIENKIAEKEKEKSLKWKDNLLKLYKKSKNKVIPLFVSLLAAYLLLFYTPFIWFMAGPLAISEMPKSADCIVVFSGGVGESGKAGQGYEERVGYAIELYKKGYADRMIFSSGYKYIFKETLVMKALAVSLGVPAEKILLEDKSRNTYENVKYSKEILEKEGWNTIMLVSSPYHMRRVSLVFDHIAKDIDVTYTPIPKSSFYSHIGKGIFSKKIDVRQINGILHEYLGIVYYWWRGWI